MLFVIAALPAFVLGVAVYQVLKYGGFKRCPEIYSAADLKEWPNSEKKELAPGTMFFWRPARPCGIFGIVHLRRRLFTAWHVFCGDLDAVRWGEHSGEAKNDGTNYQDHLDEKRAEVNPFAITLGEGEKPVMLPRFQLMGPDAPICGISGSFVFGKKQYGITAVDMEALRWLIRRMLKGEPNPDLCEEVLLLPARHVVNATRIEPEVVAAPAGSFPGKSTEVTQ